MPDHAGDGRRLQREPWLFACLGDDRPRVSPLDDWNEPSGSGDSGFAEAYAELRALAGAHFRRQPGAHTLQPTALVNEVYLRLAGSGGAAPTDRGHLLALASRAMRQVLIDHARRKKADKRGGDDPRRRVTLSGIDADAAEWDVLELHEAIERLEELDARQARIVELRFFGGLTVGQVAELLEVSERTVYLDWQMARSWLWAELGGGTP